MNKEQYVKKVTRHLNCSHKKKKQLRQELLSDIDAALEAGETW